MAGIIVPIKIVYRMVTRILRVSVKINQVGPLVANIIILNDIAGNPQFLVLLQQVGNPEHGNSGLQVGVVLVVAPVEEFEIIIEKPVDYAEKNTQQSNGHHQFYQGETPVASG